MGSFKQGDHQGVHRTGSCARLPALLGMWPMARKSSASSYGPTCVPLRSPPMAEPWPRSMLTAASRCGKSPPLGNAVTSRKRAITARASAWRFPQMPASWPRSAKATASACGTCAAAESWAFSPVIRLVLAPWRSAPMAERSFLAAGTAPCWFGMPPASSTRPGPRRDRWPRRSWPPAGPTWPATMPPSPSGPSSPCKYAPGEALPWLRTHVHAAVAIEPKHIERLLADLDSPEFTGVSVPRTNWKASATRPNPPCEGRSRDDQAWKASSAWNG